MPTKVEVKALTKIFGKRVKAAQEMLKQGHTKAEILAATGATVGVDRANFQVEEGEIFVIMGLSGSGKSTTITACWASSSAAPCSVPCQETR